MIRKKLHEKGQNLAIFAIVIVGLVGILVLVIDGGQAYMHRRDAQTAADAGAYAGAWTHCKGGTWDEVIAEVTQYTQEENKADEFTIDLDPDTGIVTVTTKINFNTFFASVLGRPQENVQAIAAAGCGPPASGQFVLPVSWVCQPEIGEVPLPGEEWNFEECLINGQTVYDFGISIFELDCRQHLGTYDELTGECTGGGAVDLDTFHATYYPDLFLVMDTDPTDLDQVCAPTGNLDCDIDDDGINDIIGAGDRAWLNLDGDSGGASELEDWVSNGFPDIIPIHKWFPGKNGAAVSVFHAAENRIGDIALVPIADGYCESFPDENTPEGQICLDLAHPPAPPDGPGYTGGDEFETISGQAAYFHIGGFGAFYISCVDDGGSGACSGLCPGHLAAYQAFGDAYISCNDKVIEGYFISGLSLPGTGGGPGDPLNIGVEDLKLTK